MRSTAEILVVTNDDELYREVGETLGRDRLTCSRARTVADAIDGLPADRPALVLIDGGLGAKLAIETCGALIAAPDRGSIGILALVTDVSDETMAALLAAGADDVVSRKLRPLSFRARLFSNLRKLETGEELADKVRDSELLIEATSRLVGTGDLQSNLYEVARLLSEELEVDRCSVVLVRSERDYGMVIASSDDPDVRNLPIDLERYPEIRRVVREQRPLVVTDVSDSELFEQVLPAVRSADVNSVALFPISRDEDTPGVIFLRFKSKRERFEERELVFCQTVANATAIALRNAEIQQLLRAKELEVEQVQTEARTQLTALRRYEDFFNSSADGMLVLSSSNVVLFVNPEGATMLGRAPDQVCGVPFATFVQPDDQEQLEWLLDDSSRGAGSRVVDLALTRDDDAETVLSVSAGTLGEQQMILLTMRDVTAQRSMARRLAEAQERLIEGEKQAAMIEVAGAAAHELNQPLTSVMTSMAMLRRLIGEGDETVTRMVTTLEQEAERMASIIRRFSKLTEYSTKSYVGQARIIDLDRAAGDGDADTEDG